jgi:hypothetical protein
MSDALKNLFEQRKALASEKSGVNERARIPQDVKVQQGIERIARSMKEHAEKSGVERSYDSCVQAQTERYQRLKREGKL